MKITVEIIKNLLEGKIEKPDNVLLISGSDDIQNFDKFRIKVKVVISEIPPLMFPPICIREDNQTYEEWNKLMNIRKALNEILYQINSPIWISGGYSNKSYSGNYGQIMYKNIIEGEEVEI